MNPESKEKVQEFEANSIELSIKKDQNSDLSKNVANLKEDCNNIIESSTKAFVNLQDFGSNSLKLLKNSLDSIEDISKVSGPVFQTSIIGLGLMSMVAPSLLLPSAAIIGKGMSLILSHPLTTISSIIIASATAKDYETLELTINSGAGFVENSAKSSYFGIKAFYDFSKSLYVGASQIGTKIGDFLGNFGASDSSKLEDHILDKNSNLLDKISEMNEDIYEILEDYNSLKIESDSILSGVNSVIDIGSLFI